MLNSADLKWTSCLGIYIQILGKIKEYVNIYIQDVRIYFFLWPVLLCNKYFELLIAKTNNLGYMSREDFVGCPG